MSLNVGCGSLIESYQSEGDSSSPELNSVTLTDFDVNAGRDELDERL